MKTALDLNWTSRSATIIPPVSSTDLIAELIDDEVLLVDPRSGQCHRLNETAAMVWQACTSQSTTLEIAEQFAESYEVSFDDALDAVEQVVARLIQLGVLDGEARGGEHD